MNCPQCIHEMIWGGDHSYEDYSIETENENDIGIVSNHSCHNEDCNVDTVLVYSKN